MDIAHPSQYLLIAGQHAGKNNIYVKPADQERPALGHNSAK